MLKSDDETTRRMQVIGLIQTTLGYDKARAAKAMKECSIAESRQVGSLGERQKERLLEFFSKYNLPLKRQQGASSCCSWPNRGMLGSHHAGIPPM